MAEKTEELVNKIADVQHNIWAHWMEYLFSISMPTEDGGCVISPDKVERWRRQMRTPYAQLTMKEQQSDRDQAVKVLDALDLPLSAMEFIFWMDFVGNEDSKDYWQEVVGFLVKFKVI